MNKIDKISWKQNIMHPSDVFIEMKIACNEDIKFLLKEKMINHIFQRRNERCEFHFTFSNDENTVVSPVDFSKIKPVRPVYPLLKQNMKRQVQ